MTSAIYLCICLWVSVRRMLDFRFHDQVSILFALVRLRPANKLHYCDTFKYLIEIIWGWMKSIMEMVDFL